MQTGSINCPSHGSVVSCSGADGAVTLVGTCPYGDTVTMAPQSLDGPFARHWNPNAMLAPEPTASEDDVIDIGEMVATVARLSRQVTALEVKVDSVQSALALAVKERIVTLADHV